MPDPESELARLGIAVPEPPAAAGSYAPFVEAAGLAFVSGQIPVRDGRVEFRGRVSDSNVDEARESARLCALNVAAQLKAGLGGLDRVGRIVRVTGYVNCGPEFSRHPEVIDAASELLSAFGKHARVAVGAASLPLGVMTELDAIAEIRRP